MRMFPSDQIAGNHANEHMAESGEGPMSDGEPSTTTWASTTQPPTPSPALRSYAKPYPRNDS